MQKFDIVIVGAGIVGLTAALACAQQSTWQIALVDQHGITDHLKSKSSLRVSAITPASQRILQRLGVWLQDDVNTSPFKKMRVWAENTTGHLDFDCEASNAHELGFIVADELLRSSLLKKAMAQTNIHLRAPMELIDVVEHTDHIILHEKNGCHLQTKLLIGADGGESWVRLQLNIATKQQAYEHHAIVAQVETELPHEQIARQRFLESGPLAFLPLSKTTTHSIVWSTCPAEAADLLALDDVSFCKKLTIAFEHKLGEVLSVSKRTCFPLQKRHATHYVKARIALIGDAAHTIHPLAGLGVNMGLLDAVALYDVIYAANFKSRNFASLATLRRYERWRKAENTAMLLFVDLIRHIFSSSKLPLTMMRFMAMQLGNEFIWLKQFFINYATGNRANMPTLAQWKE